MSLQNAQEVASKHIPDVPTNDGFMTLNAEEEDKTQFQEAKNSSIGKEHRFGAILHG